MSEFLAFEERFRDGPVPFDIHDYAADIPLHNTNASVLLGRIYDTPGNTPMDKPLGGLYELPGRYGKRNAWRAQFNYIERGY